MDLLSDAWAKVRVLAQEPWVPADRPPTSTDDRPMSSDSHGHLDVGHLGGRDGFSVPIASGPTLVSLQCAMIEQRLAINQSNAGDGAVSAKLQHAPATSSVLELVLDRMALRDCGDCGGTVESPLCSYPALRRLSMNFNAIATLHAPLVLAPLQDLRELELDFNKLQSFGPLKNSRLEQLSVSHNALAALAQLALPRLHTLDLSHNQLGKDFVNALAAAPAAEPLLRLPNLTHLDVSHNQLTSIEWVGALTKLVHLNVSHNKLASLHGVQTCAVLEELDASHNCLRYLPTLQHTNALRALGKTLTQLNVSHNEISSLGFFPNGALTQVWSLSIASNAFHGRRQSAVEGSRGSGAATVGRRGSSSIFASDDIGTAAYDDVDDGNASVASKATASRATSRGTQRSPAAAQPAEPTGPDATNAPMRRRQSADDAVTFLARLAQLFPGLEVLDVSLNSEEIIADVSDLRFLSKCTNLTELKCSGTLAFDASCVGGGRVGTATGMRCHGNKRVDAVLSFLPQIEVLDGEVLVRRDATASLAIEDLEHAGGGKDMVRPTSAGGAQHQLIRPGTSSRQKANAISASKAHDALDGFQSDMEAFMRRAETSRRRVDALLGHLSQTTAWAYGGGPEPEALDMTAIEAAVPPLASAASAREANLSDSDDDVAPGVDRLSFDASPISSSATPPSSAPANTAGRRKPSLAPPSPQPPKTGAPGKEASPSKKRLEHQQRSASVQQRQRTPLTGTAASSSTGRSSSTSRVAASGLYAESEAMKRIKSLPSASFSLEQSKFKEELAIEAQRRREQLALLTKETSAKLPAPKPKRNWASSTPAGSATLNPTTLAQQQAEHNAQQRGGNTKCETGTSMVSPAKVAGTAATHRGGRGNTTGPVVTSTVTTATSPGKFLPSDVSVGAGVEPTSSSGRGTTPPPPDAVPALNFAQNVLPPEPQPAPSPAADTTEDDEVRAAVRTGGTNVVTQDPRSGTLRPTATSAGGTPHSATPTLSDDGVPRGPTSPTAVLQLQDAHASTLGGTLRPTSAGASSRRVDRSALSVPKVRVGKQPQDWNPLIKPSTDLSMGAATARPLGSAQPRRPLGFAEANDEGSEETVFFSTKPIDVLQKPPPRAGGTSLNGRRK